MSKDLNNNKILIDEAIYGLIWCTAAADLKTWGLVDGKLIADEELAYLQYIAIEKNLKLSKNVRLSKSRELVFFGIKGFEDIKTIWKLCCKTLEKSEKINKIKAVYHMFQVSLVLEENSGIYNNYLSGSKKELSLIFKTLDILDISEEDLNQLLKGMEPELICALTSIEFMEEVLKIKGISKEVAEKILKVFENSYELSKASIKTLTNIDQMSIENAIAIHEYFHKG